MTVERTTVRRSARNRDCTSYRCERGIQRGELYNEHVTGPAHPDLDNTRWLRMDECGSCAASRGLPIEGWEDNR